MFSTIGKVLDLYVCMCYIHVGAALSCTTTVEVAQAHPSRLCVYMFVAYSLIPGLPDFINLHRKEGGLVSNVSITSLSARFISEHGW